MLPPSVKPARQMSSTHVVNMPHEVAPVCANGRGGSGYEGFLEVHRPQLEASSVPQRYWKTLHSKLENEVYDAGGVFTIVPVVESEEEEGHEDGADDPNHHICGWTVAVSAPDGINIEDPQHIYLIDHAWTYQVRNAKRHLEVVPGLLARMAGMFMLPFEGADTSQLIEDVLAHSWRYSQTYTFGNASWEDDESLEPLWYVLDEFGSRVQHSDTPTSRTVPFHHIPTKVTYTLMWPITDLDFEDELTRDYAEGIADPLKRRAKLLPWIPDDFSEISWRQTEFDEDYFKLYSETETVPDPAAPAPILPEGRKVRVFSDIRQLQTHLTHDRFEVVDTQDTADIWWVKDHFKDYRTLSINQPNAFINQFPGEMLLTVKDPMAVVARRAALSNGSDPEGIHGDPRWLPVTYNLETELAQFVSYYQHREEMGVDNHWILKPWNMARGLDMHITSDLDQIIRLQETSPKVACKYIENAVLFHREEIGNVKFDIRYIVLLASTKPLKLYAYRVFWLRFANKIYSLDHFDDYEKHFTVMNYQAGTSLKQVHYDEFIPMFEKQYPAFPWQQIEGKIFGMFKELFSAAVELAPPRGMGAAPQSRAMYAIDLMLKWDYNDKREREIQPMLCEVNFCPDCERACKYHPDFYNDVFSALFMEDLSGRPVTML